MHIRTVAAASLAVLLLGNGAEAQSARRLRVAANVGMLDGTGAIGLSIPLVAVSGTGSFDVEDDFPTMIQVDASATVTVWRQLGIGIGFSNITDELGHPYEAAVPWPIPGRLNIPASGSVAQLTHQERATYAIVSWTAPVSNRFDVVFSGGPAFFNVKQDLPTATPGFEPTSGLPVVFVGEREFSESTTGFFAGMDLDYLWGARAGLGVALRYSRASIDVPDGTTSMTVGGFVVGAGLRLKF